MSDTGRGIPELIRSQLFEPFVSHGKENGTGLGLTVVQKIVQDHGGDVTVEKTSPAGTVFRLLLPLGSSPERVSRMGRKAQTRPSRQKIRNRSRASLRPAADKVYSAVRIKIDSNRLVVQEGCQVSCGSSHSTFFFGRRLVKQQNGLPGRIRKFGADGTALLADKCLRLGAGGAACAGPTD